MITSFITGNWMTRAGGSNRLTPDHNFDLRRRHPVRDRQTSAGPVKRQPFRTYGFIIRYSRGNRDSSCHWLPAQPVRVDPQSLNVINVPNGIAMSRPNNRLRVEVGILAKPNDETPLVVRCRLDRSGLADKKRRAMRLRRCCLHTRFRARKIPISCADQVLDFITNACLRPSS